LIKLAIASPGSTYTEGCVMSLLETMEQRKGYFQAFVNAQSSDIYTVRNTVAVRALEALPDYDFMLWVDSDMRWTWEDIEALIEADGDLVTGVCPIGLQKINCASFMRDEDGDDVLAYLNGYHVNDYEKNDRGMIDVDMCGFGFLLMKRGVLESQGPQFFRHGNVIAPGGKEMLTSEDMGFTWRCKQAGFSIELHPGVYITHQKRFNLEIAR